MKIQEISNFRGYKTSHKNILEEGFSNLPMWQIRPFFVHIREKKEVVEGVGHMGGKVESKSFWQMYLDQLLPLNMDQSHLINQSFSHIL